MVKKGGSFMCSKVKQNLNCSSAVLYSLIIDSVSMVFFRISVRCAPGQMICWKYEKHG